MIVLGKPTGSPRLGNTGTPSYESNGVVPEVLKHSCRMKVSGAVNKPVSRCKQRVNKKISKPLTSLF
jgi:hypothetical protein